MASKFIRHALDREPMVIVSLAIGTFAIGLATVVPRARLALGYPTDQYFGMEDPSTGKYRSAAPRARQLEFAKELGEKPTLVEN
mmetsp:Transcript_14190/g.27598  ORF Transcript_14190/g.27598 Transcript_14190/m.27598 type:complete len:84 (+) Transcript_14190:527-778(+)|eukprot:CAMPEP_0171492166 /NCGR_PEP_ID=MMETSP0958-20121227/4262_1 /TAXON_ID=87120 /ORGANISM="Aurantiochytrium limacinum, Strain ATCCMYA-1381" /LENGTH=83 /DNA_ID=CAMNT_0012025661 /DNA_START=106 /DNA_END=357 /DNA_ORIENTATION=+